MGAITTTSMALLKNGDHVVAQRDIYGGVNKFLAQWLRRWASKPRSSTRRSTSSTRERFV